MQKRPLSANNSLLSWSLLFLLSLIWGSSFILIKKALIAFTPEQVGAGRIALAFLAFLPMFFYYYKNLARDHLWPLLIVGLTGSGFPAFLYAIAQTEVPSAIAGLLNALTPIFTFLLAVLFFSRIMKWQHSLGIILGFVGTAIIFISKHEGVVEFSLFYGLLIVLATFCYGISANTVSKYLKGVKPLVISTVSFVMIGPWVLAYLFTTDFFSVIQSHEYGLQSLLALSTLSLIGTFGANILFFRLIQMTDSVFASSVSFLTPVVALFWGYLDGEVFSVYFFFALVLIFSGVFLIKK